MGQYYKIINVDKKEYLDPSDFGEGFKLLEFAYMRTDIVSALTSLLATRWKGDRVYVVGDYAEPDEATPEYLEPITQVLNELKEAEPALKPEQSLYDYCIENFKNVSNCIDCESKVDFSTLRYIINTATREYVDLKQCPISDIYYDFKKDTFYCWSISPLILLITMGNGLGGGDYRNKDNDYLVGYWCKYSSSIQISDSYPSDYEELIPDFSENKKYIHPEDTEEFEALREEVKEATIQHLCWHLVPILQGNKATKDFVPYNAVYLKQEQLIKVFARDTEPVSSTMVIYIKEVEDEQTPCIIVNTEKI